jgi:ankyrin repeat protein
MYISTDTMMRKIYNVSKVSKALLLVLLGVIICHCSSAELDRRRAKEQEHTALVKSLRMKILNSRKLVPTGPGGSDYRIINNNRLECADFIETVVNNEVSVHTRWELGITPLMIVAAACKSQWVESFLEYGSDPRAFDARGHTALDWATYFQCESVAEKLAPY